MNNTPITVLLVEDDASDAYLVQQALADASSDEFALTHARSIEEALPLLAKRSFQVAMLDLSLPGSSGLEALSGLRHAAPQIPIVILTGYDDENLALSALKHGAQDYLVKEQAVGGLIKRSLRYAIERKHFEDSLTTLANYDPLTGLANRNLFENRLGMALARLRRSGEMLAVLFLDLDGFKDVNDRFGHEAGDEILKGVALRLTGCLREYDTVARFGGDEFAVLLEGVRSARDAAVVARKMILAIERPFTIKEREMRLGVSIGIAAGTAEEKAPDLLKNADAAMYRAKADSGSAYHFYTEDMQQQAAGRLKLEQELTCAIADKTSLCLYYQPKLDMASGRLAGAEALIRWEHPERGTLSPLEFLPLMQPSMAAGLDAFVLETVCRDIQCWQAAGLPPVQVSVHISQRLQDGRTTDGLLAALKSAGLHPRSLAVEVEETAMLHDGGGYDVLSRMRDTGIEVHLDNFGADVSSLKLLARCPLDAIKIDRSLTGSAGDKNSHATMLKALVELGHRLGLKVVAEGVETEAQRAALISMKCDEIQGYVISKPLSANDFFQWMGRRQRAAS